MKIRQLCLSGVFTLIVGTTTTFSQTVFADPNLLPTKIGGEPSGKVDSIMVSGKVTLDGFPSDQPRPAIFIAAYFNGRLAVRRQVSSSGAFLINDVPRGESTIVVEIDHNEVASAVLNYTPASTIYQDFSVNWRQFMGAKGKPGIVSATAGYQRPPDAQDLFERAVSDINKGKNDSAISSLKTVVKNDPKDFAAWSQLGNAYFLKKDVPNAETAYLRAVAENPAYTRGAVNLAKLYLSENANDKAIDLLTKTVASDPTSADAQMYLGEAYLAIKKGSKAVVYLNEAIRLAPVEKAEVHLRLAALYNAAGMKPKASAEYQQFLEKMPKYERRDELKKYITENPPIK
ncbi:MAG: tetratricopeptide repeat protein [Pyrinomonadaceae bacterium]